MKLVKVTVAALTVAAFAAMVANRNVVESQSRAGSEVDQVRRDKFRHNGILSAEVALGADAGSATASRPDASPTPTEAPTGFDNLTNGYLPQGPAMETLTSHNVGQGTFNDDRFVFEEFETMADGLGPTYNAQSCRECHQNVVTGGSSQVTVQRSGRTVNGEFFESLGGSLIHSRATYPDIVEIVADADTTRTFRISPSTLGDGYVEAIANSTLLGIRDRQPQSLRGTAVMVPVLEGTGEARIGRLGWKAQHASLVSFALDAYLNEMGITTPTLPHENTASGLFVGWGTEYDPVSDPEDDGLDPILFADFMRSTKAPSRGYINADVRAGEQVFNQISCNVCHVASITTAPPGTVINGGAFTVPAALGNKIIHPYSDFLLHNVGTGDGIPILPTGEYAATANMMKTAPLWGLRTRSRLMHDGLTFTLNDAILRHGGQAQNSSRSYSRLTNRERGQLIAFLRSL